MKADLWSRSEGGHSHASPCAPLTASPPHLHPIPDPTFTPHTPHASLVPSLHTLATPVQATPLPPHPSYLPRPHYRPHVWQPVGTDAVILFVVTLWVQMCGAEHRGSPRPARHILGQQLTEGTGGAHIRLILRGWREGDEGWRLVSGAYAGPEEGEVQGGGVEKAGFRLAGERSPPPIPPRLHLCTHIIHTETPLPPDQSPSGSSSRTPPTLPPHTLSHP